MSGSMPFTSISARSPAFLVCFMWERPKRTMILFSSRSSITSQTVAKAASSRRPSRKSPFASRIPSFPYRQQISL